MNHRNRSKFIYSTIRTETVILISVKRSREGGFGASSHEQIIDHTVSMYKDVPAYILDKLMQKFHNDFHHYGYTFDVETKIPGGFD